MLPVSTGTAAHTRLDQALQNALLELIQIDAAVGNWYGDQSPVPIRLGVDARTQHVEALIARHLRRHGPVPRFYWLRSPDLPAMTVACVIQDQTVPKFAVGLGCELGLARAMYKAFLEGVAVAKLAKFNLLHCATEAAQRVIDPSSIYDLDSNVAYYAECVRDSFSAKFNQDSGLSPGDLPQDAHADAVDAARHLVDGFKRTGKELVFLDLTTPDIHDLGFHVVRVWSPDTLALPLPCAPPVKHPRFAAFGGVVHEHPHPYP